MSEQKRPKETRMTVCDLCDQEIDTDYPDQVASLTHGYIAHHVTARTRHAWFAWPPPSLVRLTPWERRNSDPETFRTRRFDFHAACILRLVEGHLTPEVTP